MAEFRLPNSGGQALTSYCAGAGRLHGVAIDPLHGPQITMDGLRLVGRVPSQLADRFTDYVLSRGLRKDVYVSQEGDPGADELGLQLRAQRPGGIFLTRPVFVAREWADGVGATSPGHIARAEWQVHA